MSDLAVCSSIITEKQPDRSQAEKFESVVLCYPAYLTLFASIMFLHTRSPLAEDGEDIVDID